MSIDQIREEFIRHHVDGNFGNVIMPPRGRRDPRLYEREQSLRKLHAAQHAWTEHMIACVCDGEAFPDIETTGDLRFSESHTAHSSVGGGVVVGMPGGYRATEEACPVKTAWVLVRYQGDYIAVTVQQAFERRLREAAWPQWVDDGAS